MKLLLLQTDIVWESPEENRRHITELLRGAAPAGLLVLPEMFTTGFSMNPERIAEPFPGPSLRWMEELARERDCAVTGSVAVVEDGRYFNRMLFMRPDGTWDAYDKRHLFTYAGEHFMYTAGLERVVVEWRGFRILLQVCYDLRFPVFARNRGDYDLILYVANWPGSRISVWDTLLRARAIENVCYVAGVNRAGSDPIAGYPGHSAVIDFRGRTVAGTDPRQVSGQVAPEPETVIIADPRIDELRAFRDKFPVLGDADAFTPG